MLISGLQKAIESLSLAHEREYGYDFFGGKACWMSVTLVVSSSARANQHSEQFILIQQTLNGVTAARKYSPRWNRPTSA